mgnify:CR=1 FL=1
MGTIAVVTDSNSGITQNEAKELGIQVIPMPFYINGELLKAQDGLGEATIAGAAEYPVELGEDEYFLLGDNRESSEDSRFSGIGNIKRENLIGRVWLRFQPFSRLGFVR